jgi:hypothetical protein
MATRNPQNTSPTASYHAIFFDRLNEIFAARGLKPTMAADERTKRPLIHPHGSNQ